MTFDEACTLRPGQPLMVKKTGWDYSTDRIEEHNVHCTFVCVLGRHVVVNCMSAPITLTPDELSRP